MKPASPGRVTLRLIVAILIAFVFHAAYDSEISIGAARPSISLTVLLIASLFATAETGAWIGFLTGILESAYSAQFVGSYIVTRTLAGFLVGLLEERIFRDNLFVAVATVCSGTFFVEMCFFVFAPQPHPVQWFKLTALQAVYNSLLAIPIYGLFKLVVLKRSN